MRVHRGGARTALATLVLGCVLATFAAPASAQEAGDQLTIREVDTSAFPLVVLSALSNGDDVPDPADFSLRENGSFVTSFELVPVSETERRIGTVLVIDTSGSMRARGAIDQAKAAALQFVDQKLAQDRIAIVAFSDAVSVVQGFTDDTGALTAAIDGLQARGETALWEGVRTASALLLEAPDLQANMIVLSDGADTASTTSADEALAAAQSAKATVFSVGLPGGDFVEGPVRALAEGTGGRYAAATDPASLADVYGSLQRSLQGQFEIRYTSSSTEPTIQLALSTDAAQARAEAPVGAVVEGPATEPRVVKPTTGPLRDDTGRLLAGGLVFLAAALAIYAVASSVVKEESELATAMRPYDTDRVAGRANQDLVQTPLVQRAVAYTESFARKRGILPVVEGALEKADLPVRAAEAIFFYVAAVVVFGVLGYLVTGALLSTFIILLLLVLVPPSVVSFLGGKRQRDFVSQLPDTLQLLAGSLRAGYSLMQGLEAVSKEVKEPMGKELRRVLTESRLGRPVEDSLDDTAERIQSPDFSWAVMAIRIQREVGGNLAELLVTVADTMTARDRLRREIRSLTAEGRVSAILLGFLPIAIGAVIYTSNREYMEVLLTETVGQLMLAGTIVLALAGFVWLKKIITIEV